MEEDNFNPDCDNIKKNIRSFNEDMLKEEEYKEFLNHLETCSECDKYVRSVDSFSNQLWRLADVKVPVDFESTVLFQLTQPEKKPKKEEEPESVGSKKLLIAGITVIFIGITLAAGLLSYFKLRQAPEKEIVVVQTPEVEKDLVDSSVSEQDNDIDFDQLDGIAVVLDEPKEEIAFGLVDLSAEDTTAEPEVDSGPALLHWHFHQYDKTKELEALRLRRKLRKVESDLRKAVNAAEQGTETESVEGLEEEKAQIEAEISQNVSEKKRRDGEPMNILSDLNLSLDYQDSDFVLFSAFGDSLNNVLDEIALISEGSSSLKDFTPLSSYNTNKKYRISVYKVKKETTVLHWHVHLAMLNQKLQLLKTIQEYGGVVTYEFAEEVTFSISGSKVEDLKAQMPAMRISLSEYGDVVSAGDGATGIPVVISIYFSR